MSGLYTGSFGDYWYSDRAAGSPITEYYRQLSRADQYQQQQQALNSQQPMSDAGWAAAQAQAAAATEAARIKAQTSADALAWQKEQYAKSEKSISDAVSTARTDINPWRVAGEDALGRLVEKINAGPGEYTESPDYNIRLAAGEKAIERSAAARGKALSGSAVMAAQRYGTDLATQDYNNFLANYYNSLVPLQQMSGLGVNAAQAQGNYSVSGATALANLGRGSVNDMANTAIYGGESTATGITDSANIMASYQQALNELNTAYNAWRA